jgi:mitochondrial import inner membrane translocase subunit TIM16
MVSSVYATVQIDFANRFAHQAHRIITQAVLTGGRIVGRAFSEAYRQASASQKYAAATSQNPGAGRTAASSGLTLEEACKILDVPPPKQGQVEMEKVMERFKRLFDSNEPTKGGSFYIQSKVLRARQRIEMEAQIAREKAEAAAEKPWKPQIYKK